MIKLLFTLIVLCNTTTVTLFDVMLVSNTEFVVGGDLKSNSSQHFLHQTNGDAVQFVFKLDKNSDEWFITEHIAIADTIYINNNTYTFEIDFIKKEGKNLEISE